MVLIMEMSTMKYRGRMKCVYYHNQQHSDTVNSTSHNKQLVNYMGWLKQQNNTATVTVQHKHYMKSKQYHACLNDYSFHRLLLTTVNLDMHTQQ